MISEPSGSQDRPNKTVQGATMNDWGVEPSFDLNTGNGVAKLEAHIQCRLGGRIREFRLDVTDEGVVLQGHTNTYYAKQLAQHAVMEATPRPILANEIEVY
jgi:hypothetical protein